MAISPLGSLPSLAGIPQVQPFNPLEALLGGFQQGVALRQLPQQLANDQLNQQLQQALLQAKVNSLPLEAQKQQLALQQLQAQLDPNYAAKQQAAEIQFAVQKARALGQVEREMATPQQVSLKFTETENEIVAQDPFTGAVKSRTQKVPGARYQTTENGLMVFSDPANPTKGTIAPGSEPITQSTGGVQPIYDPLNPGKIIGYGNLPKGFKTIQDITPEPKPAKPKTEMQAKAKVSSVQAENAEKKLEALSKVDPTFFMPGTIERFKSDDRKDFEQASEEFTEAALRFKTGAAVTKGEVEQAMKIWIEQPGDGATTIANKKNSRKLLIREMLAASGEEPGGISSPSNKINSLIDKYK